jgi:lipopolysaccharide/colanic/teichoic acid biosynthesis glycosyltransferase
MPSISLRAEIVTRPLAKPAPHAPPAALLRRSSRAGVIALKWRAHVQAWAWGLVPAAVPRVKRALDVMGAAILLLLLLPLLVAVALVIRLESPGPVFFAQVRTGRWGREFTMWKFRSMYADAEQRQNALTALNEMAGGVIFKMKHDPRVTRVGRWLRKGSIDELPQLWNVLRGDMSLVGPRPPLPREVNGYSLADRRRLDALPGITCIWQVSGRSDIPFPRQVELDVLYIESQTLWGDIRLLLKTIPAVAFGRGAY